MNQQQTKPDVGEAAQRVLAYLEEVAVTLTTQPESQMPLQMIGPDSGLTSDIMLMAEFVEKTLRESKDNLYAPSRPQETPTMDHQAPVATGDMRESFLVAMRDSGMFPQASDATVPPQMLASLARVYMIGRIDEIRRMQGGWKAVEAWNRDYAYAMNPAWVPDHSWKWWASAPVVAPYRMGGAYGSALAEHMSAPPVWGGR